MSHHEAGIAPYKPPIRIDDTVAEVWPNLSLSLHDLGLQDTGFQSIVRTSTAGSHDHQALRGSVQLPTRSEELPTKCNSPIQVKNGAL